MPSTVLEKLLVRSEVGVMMAGTGVMMASTGVNSG